MDTVAQYLSNPSVVALVVGALGWVWHRVTSSSAAQSSSLAHAIAATRSVASSLVTTIAPNASPDELAAKVVSAGHALLSEAGIDPKSLPPLAAAMLNAVAHDAVDSFVSRTSAATPTGIASDALHAAVVNLSKSPPARAAQ